MRRIDIDLLRTVAIISVVICHTFEIPFAAVGVQIFFVVSGFLLSDFINSYSKLNFLIHRLFRLFPLAIGMCLIFYFRFTDLKWFVLNIFLLHSLFPNNESFPGGWSISYEWLFSLVIATGILYYSRLLYLLGFISIICIFLISASDSGFIKLSFANTDLNPSVLFLANLYFFILGFVLSQVQIKKYKFNLCFLLILSIAVSLSIVNLKYISWFLMVSVLSILIINNKKVIAFLEASHLKATLHLFGKYTYGIFCGHFIILISFSNFKIQGQEIRVYLYNTSGFVGEFFYLIFVLGLSVLFGSLSYRFVEKPALKIPRLLRKYEN